MKFKTQIARLLRQQQTKAEKGLWGLLRDRKFEGLKFRRQHPIKEYVVDFFCEEYGIVIELDGKYHETKEQEQKDHARDSLLRNLGYKILRFRNNNVFDNIDLIYNEIRNAVDEQKEYREQRLRSLESRKRNKHSVEKEDAQKPLIPTLSQGRGSKRILSTKKLTLAQKELLLNAGIAFVEYDAIKIKDVIIEDTEACEGRHPIFTSQNAVKAVLTNKSLISSLGEKVFCVGDKTEALLLENDLKIEGKAQNAADLANIIVKNYKNESFCFFCGNLRRAELPNALKRNGINFKEKIVYHTVIDSRIIEGRFDGILFFSPSGVESFHEKNQLGESIAFCIGNTTADEIKKHTKRYIVANKPTIENVLVQVAKYDHSSVEWNNEDAGPPKE
ncbi:DUF559 domain-containing protein [Sungkyunkwania multivorans]|uniref:DUF559 domain-containing protein n=1 Tax=Sungkyunkwania multivorans TaxID=1173618 RepID=A0ABW3CZC6_9FLAO